MTVFPPEIWRIILDNLTRPRDFRHLWLNCRNVSRMFRSEAERVVMAVFLSLSRVSLDLSD